MTDRVSVVVCTLDRERLLRRSLRGLARLKEQAFEVVVANGPSRDRSTEVARASGAQVVEVGERNLSVSRNAGVRACRGEIVAFLDDDAVPCRAWLGALVRAFEDRRVGAAGGPVLDREGRSLPSPLGVSSFGFPRLWTGSNGLAPYVTGGNMAFRRHALLECGGFDENLPFHLEDADACVRIRRLDLRVEFRPEAVVLHGGGGATRHRRPETVIRSASYFAWRHARGIARAALPLAPLAHAFARVRRSPPGTPLLLHAARCLRGALLGYAAALNHGPRLPLAP